jgi:hypothetical protein
MSPDPATNARQVAWVTGASRGIGRAVARALAEDGWTIAASARDTDALADLAAECAELPGVIHTFPLDITDADAAARAVADIEGELGDIALAILNAGTHEPVDGRALTLAPYRRLMEINYMGTVNCLVPVAERCITQRGGGVAGRVSRAADRQRLWCYEGGADQHVRGAPARARSGRGDPFSRESRLRAHAADRPEPVSDAVPDGCRAGGASAFARGGGRSVRDHVPAAFRIPDEGAARPALWALLRAHAPDPSGRAA